MKTSIKLPKKDFSDKLDDFVYGYSVFIFKTANFENFVQIIKNNNNNTYKISVDAKFVIKPFYKTHTNISWVN